MGKEKFVQIHEIRGPKSAEWADAKMRVITSWILVKSRKCEALLVGYGLSQGS